MNFLAHHISARRVCPNAPPLFFIGNILPDLATLSENRRLRPHHIESKNGDLADGARLHFRSDKAFHSSAAFHNLVAHASEQLRAESWNIAPRRIFFVAHILVEIVLDGVLVHSEPELLSNLYETVASVPPETVAAHATAIADEPTPEVVDALRWFSDSRILERYKMPDGLARAVVGVCRRAGVPNFTTDADKTRLITLCGALLPNVKKCQIDLLSFATPSWYNFRE